MSRGSAPILESPGRGPAIIEPERLYRKKPRLPAAAVLCFFLDLLREEEAAGRLKPVLRLKGEGDPIQVWRRGRGARAQTVCFPGIGAPMAASTLEELIALGVRDVIACGGAGVLDSSLPVGQALVVTSALRDEGTSYHYLKPARWVRLHPFASRAIRQVCAEGGQSLRAVRAWTTDGVYRETPGQIRKRRAEGCGVVEMEAAALAAVARFRKIRFGQLLYAGDDVSGSVWRHRDWTGQLAARRAMYRLALSACERLRSLGAS